VANSGSSSPRSSHRVGLLRRVGPDRPRIGHVPARDHATDSLMVLSRRWTWTMIRSRSRFPRARPLRGPSGRRARRAEAADRPRRPTLERAAGPLASPLARPSSSGGGIRRPDPRRRLLGRPGHPDRMRDAARGRRAGPRRHGDARPAVHLGPELPPDPCRGPGTGRSHFGDNPSDLPGGGLRRDRPRVKKDEPRGGRDSTTGLV
jgi:hypothetical protein